MKKTLTVLLAALLILGGLAAPRTAAAEAPDFKTFGDIHRFSVDSERKAKPLCPFWKRA